jgi:hypothetical protein
MNWEEYKDLYMDETTSTLEQFMIEQYGPASWDEYEEWLYEKYLDEEQGAKDAEMEARYEDR